MIISVFLCLIGLIGSIILLNKVRKDAVNGDNVIVERVNNRNSESIGYIATYIVPFLFQDFNSGSVPKSVSEDRN